MIIVKTGSAIGNTPYCTGGFYRRAIDGITYLGDVTVRKTIDESAKMTVSIIIILSFSVIF